MRIKVKAVVSGTFRPMKESGVKWIGSIPENWDVQKVKNAFDRKKEEAHQKEPVVLSLARSGVKIRDISTNEGQLAESYYNYNPVDKGDLLINPMDLYSGANCSISNVEGVISPAYINLRARSGYNPRYYDYYFKTQYWSLALFAHGKGVSFDNRWTLGFADLNNYQIPAPSFEEQNDIANYLDAQCASIDSVIEKTRESIEEYKKLKQSIITEAVTKGIRPNRKMKDSGMEWVGTIPDGWKTPKMGIVCNVITDYVASGSFASLADNVQYLDEPDYAMLIRTADVSNKGYNSKPVYINQHAYEFLSNSNLVGGELMFPNIGASVGDVYIIPILYERMSLAPNSIMVKTNYVDKYYYYYFKSDPGRLSIEDIARSTAQAKFNKTDFRQLKTLLPSIQEQIEIVRYLDVMVDSIDVLETKKEKLVLELESYKKAIIYEYVTGKKEVPSC